MNRRVLPLVLSAALFAPALSLPVSAQEMMRITATSGDIGSVNRVSRRSVEKYAEMLKLTPDQKSLALTLHEGYETAVESAQKDFQAATQEMQKSFQDTQDETVWTEKMPKARKEYQGKTKVLEKGFFDDLKSLLTTDQQGSWDSVERARRREVVLRGGARSGEGVDLISIVDGLKLPSDARTAVTPALSDYEVELDKALVAKQNELLDQGGAFEPGKPIDPAEMKQRLEKAREQGQRIKEVNQSNARRIEGLLPEDKKAEFARAVQQASFPRVYRPSAVSHKIDAALGLADLDAKQRESLQDLKSSYERDLAPVNDHWASAIEDQEKSGQGGGTMVTAGGSTMTVNFGQDDTGPVADARKARRELDDRIRQKLEGVLTKDQKDRLPKESPGIDDGGHMMLGTGDLAPIVIRKTEDERR